jgi:enamine deaminase RidA (YjgF/YER057c/UK114 family)
MTITRIGTTRRWSDIVVHNGTLYVVEVPETLAADITGQTKEVLASLEDSLRTGGSSPERLLAVTIYLADIDDLEAFNAVWDAWVPVGHAPVRACVQSRLAKAGYKVELQVTAAAGSASG